MNDISEPNVEELAVVESPSLKESIVKNSLEWLDWPLLKNHLDEVVLDDVQLDFLLGHLRRTSSLILAYPKKGREKLRTKFFEELDTYISVVLGAKASGLLSQEILLLDKIERGYRGIIDLLEKCDISRLSLERRVAAYISRTVHEYTNLMEAFHAVLNSREEVYLPRGPLLSSENKEPVSPDGVLTALVESLTMTLVMEGYKNNLFDADSCVVIPLLSPVGEDERFMAGSNEVLAQCWRRWRRTEERRRFLGGHFEELIAPDLPEGMPEIVERLTLYKPSEIEFFDFIANERLNDRLGQTYVNMLVETNIEAKVTGIVDGVSLIPDSFVSIDEVHSAVSLSEILGYDIANDDERPCGLRLAEWLRGYSVFKLLAHDRNKACGGAENLTFFLPREELTGILSKCGLVAEAADTFIKIVTLKSSSRDLFDCPLIKVADGSLMFFSPALLTANLTRIILSSIANLGDPLSRKGKAFERCIRTFFEGMGLEVGAFKVNKEGAEYEYDVVLHWDDYIFVFECKNHSLSNYHPVQAYYFELEARSNAKQVTRLTEALLQYPEILSERFNVDVTTKKLVPCVLNSLPYSLPGKVEGVYFTDTSALKRFFEERYCYIKTPHQVTKDLKVLHRMAIHSQWEADHPSPEDLIKQLEDPFQVKVVQAHTELGVAPFAIGATEAVIAYDFSRTEMSVESFCEMAGLSSKTVRKEMNSVRKQVRKVRKERKRKLK